MIPETATLRTVVRSAILFPIRNIPDARVTIRLQLPQLRDDTVAELIVTRYPFLSLQEVSRLARLWGSGVTIGDVRNSLWEYRRERLKILREILVSEIPILPAAAQSPPPL